MGRKFKLHYAGRDTPVPNAPYKISLSDGRTVEGVSDAEGHTQLSEHDAYFISKIDVFTPTT